MSIASKILKKFKEDFEAISNPISMGTASSLHNVPPADPNGIVPDKSDIKKKKKSTLNNSFNNGKRETAASKLLEEKDVKKELGALDAWKHQFQMDINPEKVTAEQLKMGDVPRDVLEILLMADPASANSFVYKVQGTEPDKYCRTLNVLPDGITVVLRSGSIVVFDGKNNAYSYNREALTNLLLSKRTEAK